MTRSFNVKNNIYITNSFHYGVIFSLNKKRFFTTDAFSLYNNYEEFSRQIHFYSNTNKDVFHHSHCFIIYKPKDKTYEPINK